MTDLEVREATEADLPGVLRLYGQPGMQPATQPTINDGTPLTLEAAAKIFQRMSTYPSYALYVAVRERVVVGTLALLIMDNLAHGGAPAAIVENVCVDERWRGHGMGRAMMTFAMEAARAKGCYKLSLSSNASRERAHAFYRTLGFEQHGISFAVTLT